MCSTLERCSFAIEPRTFGCPRSVPMPQLVGRYRDRRSIGVVTGMGYGDIQQTLCRRMPSHHDWWWFPMSRPAVFHAEGENKRTTSRCVDRQPRIANQRYDRGEQYLTATPSIGDRRGASSAGCGDAASRIRNPRISGNRRFGSVDAERRNVTSFGSHRH